VIARHKRAAHHDRLALVKARVRDECGRGGTAALRRLGMQRAGARYEERGNRNGDGGPQAFSQHVWEFSDCVDCTCSKWNRYKILVKLVIKRRQLSDQISELTTNRLSVYLRCLNALDTAGVKTVSSQALAQQFHLNAAQIRKDLANFGEFGVRGVGYYVKDLQQHLRQILGLERKLKIAILGAGNLGLALADYPGFRQEGFQIAALFDALASKVGQRSRAGVPIFDIKDLRKITAREKIAIAVIAVPADSAQLVVNQVVAAGIKAILNFSPGTLWAPDDVKLKSVDLTVSLQSLSFYLANEPY